MNGRIELKFKELKTKNRKALIPFIMPGAEGETSTAETVLALEAVGADIVELGIPFSDPVADGPVIQRAASIALGKGITTDDVFDSVAEVRGKSQIPILLLVYYNTIYSYGIEEFIARCSKSGLDGLIIPDLPYEERGEMDEVIGDLPINIITLAAPTSAGRLTKILPSAKGFIYCVSTTGVTGERSGMAVNLQEFMENVKRYVNDTPRAIGFGISTPEQAKAASSMAEGVIIGSALVRRLIDEGFDVAIGFIKSIRNFMDE